ncbi:hypothetical protein ACX0HA_12860 [Flavobacterium hauense]
MKKFKIIYVLLVVITAITYSCKDKSSTNEESYGPTETSRDATPTENDKATNNTSAHETGPGSATVGDTLNKKNN